MQRAMTDAALPYLLHRPAGDGKLPLMLFLHGSGERGTDLNLVKDYSLPRDLERRPDYPMIVVSPQCPPDVRWTDLTDALVSLLETVIAAQDADTRRIYLSGFSMGGQGAWNLAVTRPDLFAAVAPVAARIPPEPGFLTRLCRVATLPVWAAHGDADERVPFENSQMMVDTLRECGGNVRFTRYEGYDHALPSDVFFAGDALVNWCLEHHRPVEE
jgi:predicted peptidase